MLAQHIPAARAAALTTAGTTGNAGDIPRIFRSAEGAVFSGASHGKFIEIGFAEDDRAGGLELLHDSCGVGSLEILQHFGGTGGVAVIGAEVVFDGDGHTGKGAGDFTAVDIFCLLQARVGCRSG